MLLFLNAYKFVVNYSSQDISLKSFLFFFFGVVGKQSQNEEQNPRGACNTAIYR